MSFADAKLPVYPYKFAAQNSRSDSVSCEQTACPRQAPPRAACSPDLGGPWAGAPARLSPISPSHRLSPLKVSAFFKRTLRPPAPRGAFFCTKQRTFVCGSLCKPENFPKNLPHRPNLLHFFATNPLILPYGVKGLFHTHPPHHTIVTLRSSISRCPHAFGVPERAGPGPIRKLSASTPAQHKEPPGSELFFLPPINRDRTLRTSYPAREPAQVAIIFVAFLQNSAKQPPFLCETKIFCKIPSFLLHFVVS